MPTLFNNRGLDKTCRRAILTRVPLGCVMWIIQLQLQAFMGQLSARTFWRTYEHDCF